MRFMMLMIPQGYEKAAPGAVPGAKAVAAMMKYNASLTKAGVLLAGDATKVTWAMFGPSPYLSKVMGLVFSMEAMVGGSFEQGLANLKAIAEK